MFKMGTFYFTFLISILAVTDAALNTPFQIALIVDSGNNVSEGFEASFVSQLKVFNNISSNESVNFDVHTFQRLRTFVNVSSSECPFFVVVAVIPCADNVILYQHLRQSCPSTVLFTIFEFICERPPNDIGIGIPQLETQMNVIPLLADFSIALGDRWQQVIVFYDTPLDIIHFEQFFSLLKSVFKENEMEEYLMTDESLTSQTLSEKNMQILSSHKSGCRKCLFFVIGSRTFLEKVIYASKQLSLINLSNKWIFVFSEPSPVHFLSDQVQNIVSESDVLLVQPERNMNCINLHVHCLAKLLGDVLQRTFRNALVSSSLSWENKQQVKQRILSQSKIILAHQNFTHFSCGNCNHFKIESLVKHRTNDIVDRTSGVVQVNPKDIQFKIMLQQEGNWNVFKGLLIKKEHDSETNLKNRPLNIGIVDQPPMIRIYKKQDKNGVYGNSSQEIVGTTYEMVLVLAAKFNFTPNFIVDYSANLGYIQSDGTWTGMLKKVASGEVDIGANGYWQTYDRLKAFDLTFPFNLKEISMLVKKTDEDHKYLFLAPFTWDAWLSIMATVFLMGPFLWLVHRSSKYYEYYGLSDGKGLFKLGNCVWYCFGAIVQQGGDYLPLAISGRILITFWWLFVIVTVTTYSGNLVALLTFPKIFNPINDLNDLIAFKSLLKYGATRTSGIEELIKDSADVRMQMLGDNLFYYDSVDSESLFEEVKKMKMVFLATETEIKYLISEDFKRYNNCQLMIAKEPILTKSVSFVVGKDKPPRFKAKLDYEIGRMAKSGLVNVWNKKYEVKGDDCLFPLQMRAGDVHKIELKQMIDCFFVLALGVIVAIISLTAEMIKPGERDSDEKSKKLNLTKVAQLFKVSQVWQKMTSVYDKVKNGQLYEGWAPTSTSNQVGGQANQAGLPTRPIYHNYFTYNTSNRAAPPGTDWGAQLQRNQRPFYLQRNGWNGFANAPHINLQRGNPYWNATNRY